MFSVSLPRRISSQGYPITRGVKCQGAGPAAHGFCKVVSTLTRPLPARERRKFLRPLGEKARMRGDVNRLCKSPAAGARLLQSRVHPHPTSPCEGEAQIPSPLGEKARMRGDVNRLKSPAVRANVTGSFEKRKYLIIRLCIRTICAIIAAMGEFET